MKLWQSMSKYSHISGLLPVYSLPLGTQLYIRPYLHPGHILPKCSVTSVEMICNQIDQYSMSIYSTSLTARVPAPSWHHMVACRALTSTSAAIFQNKSTQLDSRTCLADLHPWEVNNNRSVKLICFLCLYILCKTYIHVFLSKSELCLHLAKFVSW